MIVRRTKGLIAEAIPPDLHLIPVYGTNHITSKVRNVKVKTCRNTGNRRVVQTPLGTGARGGGARC